jgi:CubicO group peptidase (beta-lactamase class C family)
MTSALAAELREIIERERGRFAVPGCAVVVIAGGEPVLCEGFGLRDIAGDLPVTPRTLFPIASATKTFTAALCTLAAADGVLDLHRPARDYLPELQLADPDTAARISVYDMLCHRTGLPRHDLLWYTAPPEVDRAGLVGALRHLDLNLPFRSAWQYNNLLYVVAGYLAGQVLGQSYEEAVADRLFGPLGMARTTFSSARMLADEDAARPYVAATPGEPLKEVPLAPLDRIAPAGGINSCASDLLPWVQALLGNAAQPDGADQDSTVLADGVLTDLRTVRIGLPEQTLLTIGRPVGYGLGLIVEDYHGHRVLHHGGDIDGFTSQISFIPDAGCAVVFLANRAGTGMRDALPCLIYDRVLGLGTEPHGELWLAREQALLTALANPPAPSEQRGLPMVRPAADYAGRYQHPAYGELTVTSKGDDLHLAYRIVAGPLKHRTLEVFDLTVDLGGAPEHFPAQFRHDLDGEVSAVTVLLERAAEPVCFERVPDTDQLTDELLTSLAGTYRLGPLTAMVRRHGPRGLTALIIQGYPRELRCVGGLVFRLGNDRVEFTRDGRLICPAGEFSRDIHS